MRLIAATTILSLVVAASAVGPAQAKGCLKGAAVGGVAGHMAGHGVLGAAAGCAIGHHEANKNTPEQARSSNDNDRGTPTTR